MTRIFFAGLESHYKDLAKQDVEFALASFHNMSNGKCLEYVPTTMVDSGAHSIHEGSEVDIDDFCDRYIEFLKENWENISYYVELDVEEEYGMDKVLELRERMEEELPKPPIVVWHRGRGTEGWKEMCKNYDYVGFSGFVTKDGDPEVPDEYIPWFLKVAREHDTKVHGFGLTKPSKLKMYDFYSADSTSWLSGQKFGTYYDFQQGDLRSISKDAFIEKYGKRFNDLDYKDLNYWNIEQWKKFHKFLEGRRE